jgi:hypothetical protein
MYGTLYVDEQEICSVLKASFNKICLESIWRISYVTFSTFSCYNAISDLRRIKSDISGTSFNLGKITWSRANNNLLGNICH